ncbi:MAG: methyltransferase [Clostridiales bacterium]|nr:methyltransferase [Clostridiales bacterium]
MKRNMYKWLEDMRISKVKKAMPVLSFPAIQLLGITVKELISNSDTQAQAMKLVADRVDSAASVSMMDLSVEAEAFGSKVNFSDDEVPTVIGRIIETPEDVENIKVPAVGDGRTGLYIEAIKKAVDLIDNKPVFAGVIGPFSLAGRLMDVTEIMVNCYVEPEMVHNTLRKVTEFLIKYIKEYKNVGANGVVIAEPLAGILSPDLIGDFSSAYVKEIVNTVQDENFIVIYHNCGNNVLHLMDSILEIGASAYHFGNAVSMAEVMKKVPEDTIAMGNVDPARQFRNGTPESVREETLRVMNECKDYSNFVISSGCDIPPLSSWDNIDAFFKAVEEFYQ